VLFGVNEGVNTKKKSRSTIKFIFFKYYFLLMLVTVLPLGVFFYWYTSRIMVSKVLDSAEKLAVSLSGQLDLEIRKMDTVSINVAYSNLIRDHFARYLGETSDPVSRYKHSKLLTDVFIAISGPFLTVQQVNLYDFNGKVLGAGYFNGSAKVDLRKKPWYTEVLSLDGKKYISKPYDNAFFVGSTYKNRFFVSLFRVYFNNLGERVGIIEVARDYDSIFAALDRIAGSGLAGMEIYVLDSSNDLVYPVSPKNAELSMYLEYVKGVLEQRDRPVFSSVFNSGMKGKRLMTYATSEYTGWKVLLVQPMEMAMLPIAQFSKFVIVIIGSISLFSFLLSFLVSDKITGPIRRLNQTIKNTALDTLDQEDSSDFDGGVREIEELYAEFRVMRSKLKESVNSFLVAKQKEMEAKFSALQSQISPHFLRNCLTNISVMAEEGDVKAATAMCRNISYMLYYVCKSDPSVVSLATEIDYIQKYLECIKLRYGESLKYQISIEGDAGSVFLPKLLVQPLVENAVEHGTNIEPPWFIKIAGKIDGDLWKIQVEDNGPGFSFEKLESLRRKIDEIRSDRKLLDTKFVDSSIGLLNVFLRLYMFCGDNAIFEIENKRSGGALVTIGGPFRIQ